jgi:hypothetical protein
MIYVELSALIAFCCAENVVATIGQPFPAPFRFCIVTAAAFKRAFCAAVLLSVGNVRSTDGFRRTWPARIFAVRF